MKKKLTYDTIVKHIEEENERIKKKEKFSEKFSVALFGTLLMVACIGGFFIWFQFDLYGPKHLSFLGILWGLIIGIPTFVFLCRYWANKISENTRIIYPFYDVAEDIIQDIRYRNNKQKELYCSFAGLKQYHNYGYTKLPEKYKNAKPGDKFCIVIDHYTNDIVFMCTDTEYSIKTEKEYNSNKEHVLYYETIENLIFSDEEKRGIKLNNSNSQRKIQIN